jgi:ankyrin repeat protein
LFFHRAGFECDGFIEKVKLLLKWKADINALNEDGESALIAAIHKEHVAIVKILLDYGACIHIINNDNYTPLGIAYEYGFNEIVQLLQNKIYEVNSFQ